MNKSIRYFESFDHEGLGHGENVLLLFIVATCMLGINQVVCMYTVLIRKKDVHELLQHLTHKHSSFAL